MRLHACAALEHSVAPRTRDATRDPAEDDVVPLRLWQRELVDEQLVLGLGEAVAREEVREPALGAQNAERGALIVPRGAHLPRPEE